MNEQSAQVKLQNLNQRFDGLVVSHPMYVSGWDRMLKILNLRRNGAKPSGLMLLGDPGTGKTTMSKHLEAHGNLHCTGFQQRVIYSSLNGSTALGSVYSSILDRMGDPSPESGTNPRKLQRLVAGLTAKKTDVLIIDETQHLITKRFGGNANLREVTNALKSILDNGTTSLILSGLPEARQLWEDDLQLRRRFLPPIEFKDFTLNENEAWRDVIRQMVMCCMEVGVDKPATSLGELSDRMMLATHGKISTAARIIKEAASLAITGGLGALSLELLNRACLETIAEEDSTPSAFTMKAALLPHALDDHLAGKGADSDLAPRPPTMGQVLSQKGALK